MFIDLCIVPEDGHRNKDGYIRVLDKPRKEGGRLCMLHRLEWEKINGPIPDGYEINHRCRNRECSNINHLECLEKSKHKSIDNAIRYKDREDAIVAFILRNPSKTVAFVAGLFDLTRIAVQKIIKRRIKFV